MSVAPLALSILLAQSLSIKSFILCDDLFVHFSFKLQFHCIFLSNLSEERKKERNDAARGKKEKQQWESGAGHQRCFQSNYAPSRLINGKQQSSHKSSPHIHLPHYECQGKGQLCNHMNKAGEKRLKVRCFLIKTEKSKWSN